MSYETDVHDGRLYTNILRYSECDVGNILCDGYTPILYTVIASLILCI